MYCVHVFVSVLLLVMSCLPILLILGRPPGTSVGAVETLGKYFLFVGENITHTRYAIIMTMFRFMIIENSDNNYSGSVLPVCSIEHRSNDENYSSINYGMVAIIIINN